MLDRFLNTPKGIIALYLTLKSIYLTLDHLKVLPQYLKGLHKRNHVTL